MLGPSNAHVNAAAILHEAASSGTHHWDEDEVEFATLWAVYWQDLVVGLAIDESLCNCIFLSVVWRYNIYRVLGELLNRYTGIDLIALKRLIEDWETVVEYSLDCSNLSLVPVWSLLFMLTAFSHINKQERSLWKHKLLFEVASVAALDAILVVQ